MRTRRTWMSVLLVAVMVGSGIVPHLTGAHNRRAHARVYRVEGGTWVEVSHDPHINLLLTKAQMETAITARSKMTMPKLSLSTESLKADYEYVGGCSEVEGVLEAMYCVPCFIEVISCGTDYCVFNIWGFDGERYATYDYCDPYA